jgi:hypothetical protein
VGRDDAIWRDFQGIYDADETVHGLISGTGKGGPVRVSELADRPVDLTGDVVRGGLGQGARVAVPPRGRG